jgi:hypothetical protein
MDDYREKARKKFMEQKNKDVAELTRLLDAERIQKEAELREKEEQIKKQVYIQTQILLIEDAIHSYNYDKTDDNIMLILTIISGGIDNIKESWTQEDIVTITNMVISFSNSVDATQTTRPKGVDTIANVKILKEAFEQIFNLLKLDIEVKALDTDGDEEYAKQLQETFTPSAKKTTTRKLHDVKDKEIPDKEIPDVKTVKKRNYNKTKSKKNKKEEHKPLLEEDIDEMAIDDGFGRIITNMKDDTKMKVVEVVEDVEEPIPNMMVEDERLARALQEEMNKTVPKVQPPVEKAVLSKKFSGMSADDFINALMTEKA